MGTRLSETRAGKRSDYPRSPIPHPLRKAPSGDHFIARFTAMSCPCDVLMDATDEALAKRIAGAVQETALRIERKFSRYRDDNIVRQINTANGAAVMVDDETANLLDFAATLTELSQGKFDITSGVLRRAWEFDGGDRLPSQAQIDALLPLVGWGKVQWRRPVLQMAPGMQIDFGGIGKEYAVDLAVARVHDIAPGVSCLVNFGGDVAVRTARADGQPWRVGVEVADAPGASALVVPLADGALATSGDSRRYVLANGKRYSHILNARTGWPIEGAPRSVTVAADACTQAGMLTTLAMLQGADARAFLEAQNVRFWMQS